MKVEIIKINLNNGDPFEDGDINSEDYVGQTGTAELLTDDNGVKTYEIKFDNDIVGQFLESEFKIIE